MFLFWGVPLTLHILCRNRVLTVLYFTFRFFSFMTRTYLMIHYRHSFQKIGGLKWKKKVYRNIVGSLKRSIAYYMYSVTFVKEHYACCVFLFITLHFVRRERVCVCVRVQKRVRHLHGSMLILYRTALTSVSKGCSARLYFMRPSLFSPLLWQAISPGSSATLIEITPLAFSGQRSLCVICNSLAARGISMDSHRSYHAYASSLKCNIYIPLTDCSLSLCHKISSSVKEALHIWICPFDCNTTPNGGSWTLIASHF